MEPGPFEAVPVIAAPTSLGCGIGFRSPALLTSGFEAELVEFEKSILQAHCFRVFMAEEGKRG
jgi:hypothetical protein